MYMYGVTKSGLQCGAAKVFTSRQEEVEQVVLVWHQKSRKALSRQALEETQAAWYGMLYNLYIGVVRRNCTIINKA